MQQLPSGLDLDSLPGPKRGVSPAIYIRDEAVFSPSGKRFALAYTIAEASMGNDIGCLLWGETTPSGTVVLGNPEGVHATCWQTPWAVWLDEETFVFKAQQYDGTRLHLPLVAIEVTQGFVVLPGTSNGDSRPQDVKTRPTRFAAMSTRALLHALTSGA